MGGSPCPFGESWPPAGAALGRVGQGGCTGSVGQGGCAVPLSLLLVPRCWQMAMGPADPAGALPGRAAEELPRGRGCRGLLHRLEHPHGHGEQWGGSWGAAERGEEHPRDLPRVAPKAGKGLVDPRPTASTMPGCSLPSATSPGADGVSLPFQFSCCGVLGPEDFGNGSRFQELHPGTPWPQACCARAGLLQAGELRSWEQCRERSPGYIHEQVGRDTTVSLSCPQRFPGWWQWGSSTLSIGDRSPVAAARGSVSLRVPCHPALPRPRSPSEHPEPLQRLAPPQGCFSAFGRTLQQYVSLPGTCSLAVLGIEVLSGAGGDGRAGAGSGSPRQARLARRVLWG